MTLDIVDTIYVSGIACPASQGAVKTGPKALFLLGLP